MYPYNYVKSLAVPKFWKRRCHHEEIFSGEEENAYWYNGPGHGGITHHCCCGGIDNQSKSPDLGGGWY